MSEFIAGTRPSQWAQTTPGRTRGPEPHPPWLVTSAEAVEHERSVVRTGKEAEAYLIERVAPDGGSCLMLCKRYRTFLPTTTMLTTNNGDDHKVAGSREKRALARRTRFGIGMEKSEWAAAEFRFLRLFYEAGLAVPYPIQYLGHEVVMEWIGDDDGQASPRVCDIDLDPGLATHLYEQITDFLIGAARLGYAHGDLSVYNVLVRHGDAVIIDCPQVVDIARNPLAPSLLERDCVNVTRWLAERGATARDPQELLSLTIAEAWSS
ncbi:hypothetical protein NSA19_11610 [Actinomyces bowdenii]|uniref:RIO1 family regulatory kinase/ATPase domain-containing protein n=1 Tax=Actinomyces bowdenii TaxID=131109 RepID=UPI00214D03AE|nr:RIO1 family regulatory kinase/ATPase [Actinomyces bowdenii]MCR2053471.1 hypothetical protein [Actinomyces bowdenii]